MEKFGFGKKKRKHLRATGYSYLVFLELKDEMYLSEAEANIIFVRSGNDGSREHIFRISKYGKMRKVCMSKGN